MKSRFCKNIIMLYTITFFDGFILAYVIERLFWAERGLTITMVVATEIVYGITVALFEIPSGIMADILGRKRMLLIAASLSVCEFIIIYFAHGFWLFALAVLVAGISNALKSGSLQAIMYDSLAVEGKESKFETIYGRYHAIDTLGASAAALIGGVTAFYWGYEFNYAVSIGCKLIAFLLLFNLSEPPREKLVNTAVNSTSFLVYGKRSAVFLKSHPLLFTYCVNGMVLGACWNYMDEFWQLLMQAIKVPVIFFGVISVLYSIFSIPGNLLVEQIKNKISYQSFFAIIPFIYGIGFSWIAVLNNKWIFAPMVMMGIWHGVITPLLDGYIHHRTESSIRATVESMVSFMMRAISIVVGFIFSLFSSNSIFKGFLSLGVICLAYGMVNLILLKKCRVIQ
ncbi:MAG: transporter [Herbinix sp.]|nr:transporter [Herbinix sp.]